MASPPAWHAGDLSSISEPGVFYLRCKTWLSTFQIVYLCTCFSDETLKSVGSFCLMSMSYLTQYYGRRTGQPLFGAPTKSDEIQKNEWDVDCLKLLQWIVNVSVTDAGLNYISFRSIYEKFRPITRFETTPRLLPLGGSHTALRARQLEQCLEKNTVPKKRTDSDTEEQGTLALRLIELLNDDAVLDKLKQVLYPNELSTQLK